MNVSMYTVRSIVVFYLVMNATVIAGCSGGEANEETVDSLSNESVLRFATVDALVEKFNSITMMNPRDHRGECEMIYPENDLQRRLLQIENNLILLYELAVSVRERFDKPLLPDSPEAFNTLPHQELVVITKQEDNRAEGLYTDSNGETVTLYLVRVGQWWRISGRTLEQYPGSLVDDPAAMTYMEEFSRFSSAVVPDVLQKLEAGEFDNYEQFREAYSAASVAHARDNPDAYPAMAGSKRD